MKSRRILIVCHSYKPKVDPRAIRWSAIAEDWAAQGHKLDIICAWEPGWANFEVLRGVRVHRVGGRIIGAWHSRIKKLLHGESGLQNQLAVKAVEKNHSATTYVSFAKWFHDHTWKKIYWPDYACRWYWPAFRKAKELLGKYYYDNLISVSYPFTGHLVGFSCKKRCSHIKWLVDIGDPFCFAEITPPNNFYIFNRINHNIEKIIFDYASAISVTNQLTLEKYSELFPNSATKLVVVPPLIALTETCRPKEYHTDDNNNIKLVFVGSLYRSIRNPRYVLNLFERLLKTHLSEKLEIHFWGSLIDCENYFEKYRHLLLNKIFVHGKVDRATALQAMQKAQILLNIGNDSPFQLPSKIVEYMGMRKPILNIAKISQDSSYALLRNYPASLTLWDQGADPTPDQLAECLQFIEQPPRIDLASLRPWLSKFELVTIAKSYEELLEK